MKLSVFLITAALIAGVGGCDGDGGYDPPPSQNLEIRTWYDLNATRDNLAGNHTLMNDLNSTTPGYEELAGPTANGGKGWQPIGTENYEFTGSLDGQGHEIRDLFISRPDEDWVGLFSLFLGAHIENIGVVNVTVTGYGVVGSLAAVNGGTVSNSYFTGNVTGQIYVGGLVGENGGTISNSYSTGSVIGGDRYVGGLVGWNEYGIVSNSYSTGSVTGNRNVGGLLGDNDGTLSNSYSTGNVTGDTDVGGLVGDSGGNVTNSFWDIQTSGQSGSAGGTGLNTTEMQNIATFSDAGWNITAVALNETNPVYIWNIVNNLTYPFLSWQP
jgi:hypothetical protein